MSLHQTKRYLAQWFLTTVVILLTVAVINLVVDPYGIFRLVDQPGFNSIKPAAASQGAMSKTYQVLRVRPKTLILGNSRAEVGLDPNHPAWPQNARPVYNAALPGTGTATSLQTLQRVLDAAENNGTSKPTVVVWGLDYMDFLVDPNKRDSPKPFQPLRWQQRLRDHAEATLTLGTLVDSVQTLVNQSNPYSVDQTHLGFNPMRDYHKITADEGYWNVFRQKDIANIKVFDSRTKSIWDARKNTSPHFEDLREVIRLCHLHGIELHLFTYPYHAHLLEIFRITGHWSTFEDWKRALVRITEEEAVVNTKQPISIWDFSTFNEMSTDPIPAKGDRQYVTKWYWESGHFKQELGDQMLQLLFYPQPIPNGLGDLLTASKLDAHLLDVSSKAALYRSRYHLEIKELESIFTEISRRRIELSERG